MIVARAFQARAADPTSVRASRFGCPPGRSAKRTVRPALLVGSLRGPTRRRPAVERPRHQASSTRGPGSTAAEWPSPTRRARHAGLLHGTGGAPQVGARQPAHAGGHDVGARLGERPVDRRHPARPASPSARKCSAQASVAPASRIRLRPPSTPAQSASPPAEPAAHRARDAAHPRPSIRP